MMLGHSISGPHRGAEGRLQERTDEGARLRHPAHYDVQAALLLPMCRGAIALGPSTDGGGGTGQHAQLHQNGSWQPEGAPVVARVPLCGLPLLLALLALVQVEALALAWAKIKSMVARSEVQQPRCRLSCLASFSTEY